MKFRILIKKYVSNQVLKQKKAIFNANLEKGNLPSPSLQEIIKNDDQVDQAVRKAKSKAQKF